MPPYGDPAYAALRGSLAVSAPGETGGGLRLDNVFGLHPSLAFLHESFSAKELIVLHAVATPYRERSHFDGQDVLESGMVRPHASETGWLNRALTVADVAPSGWAWRWAAMFPWSCAVRPRSPPGRLRIWRA